MWHKASSQSSFSSGKIWVPGDAEVGLWLLATVASVRNVNTGGGMGGQLFWTGCVEWCVTSLSLHVLSFQWRWSGLCLHGNSKSSGFAFKTFTGRVVQQASSFVLSLDFTSIGVNKHKGQETWVVAISHQQRAVSCVTLCQAQTHTHTRTHTQQQCLTALCWVYQCLTDFTDQEESLTLRGC